MKNLIYFEDAIRKGIIKEGDYVDPQKCFRRERTGVLLDRNFTGWITAQYFIREDNLKWIYHKDYNREITLFGTTTNFKLYLQGIVGFDNAVKVLNHIHRTYTNDEYGILSRGLTESDIKYFERYTDNSIFQNMNSSWLMNNSFVDFVPKDVYSEQGNLCPKLNPRCIKLFRTEGIIVFQGITPVITFSGTKKLMVDTESMKRDGKWELIPASKN